MKGLVQEREKLLVVSVVNGNRDTLAASLRGLNIVEAVDFNFHRKLPTNAQLVAQPTLETSVLHMENSKDLYIHGNPTCRGNCNGFIVAVQSTPQDLFGDKKLLQIVVIGKSGPRCCLRHTGNAAQ